MLDVDVMGCMDMHLKFPICISSKFGVVIIEKIIGNYWKFIGNEAAHFSFGIISHFARKVINMYEQCTKNFTSHFYIAISWVLLS